MESLPHDLPDLEPIGGNRTKDAEHSDEDQPTSRNPHFNRNPEGNNQYDTGLPHTPEVEQWLRDWAARGMHNAKLLSQLAEVELGVKCSGRSVTRARAKYKITASGGNLKRLGAEEAKKLVVEAIERNPSRTHGLRSTCSSIQAETGLSLPQKFVHGVMKEIDPKGFEERHPGTRILHRGVLTSGGLHDEWSGDGHDKLGRYGLWIWGVREKLSRQWLGVRVVPNNRVKEVVAYVWLEIVERVGGVPVQMTTDCGSENPVIFGLTNALRDVYASGLDPDQTPAHRFLKSVHNITIERGWHTLSMSVLRDIKELYQADHGCYNSADPRHFLLARYIWAIAVQTQLDATVQELNNRPTRRDPNQNLPSGISPAVFSSLHKKWGYKNMLISVPREVVKEMMEAVGGEDIIRFVSRGYEEKAQLIKTAYDIPDFTIHNAWDAFESMLPHMAAPEPDELAFAGL
ncbi:hypothetical protein FRB90_002535 [Tulasnella sp. 427]|nr:hypothetical protein FRB90_002535 [Tulasnella sp. 427]